MKERLFPADSARSENTRQFRNASKTSDSGYFPGCREGLAFGRRVCLCLLPSRYGFLASANLLAPVSAKKQSLSVQSRRGKFFRSYRIRVDIQISPDSHGAADFAVGVLLGAGNAWGRNVDGTIRLTESRCKINCESINNSHRSGCIRLSDCSCWRSCAFTIRIRKSTLR